jgi:hypothetical protein
MPFSRRIRWGALAAGLIVGVTVGTLAQSPTPTPGTLFGDPAGSIGSGAGLDGLTGAGVSNLPIDPTAEGERLARRAALQTRLAGQAADYARQATGMLTSAQSYLAAVSASTQQSATYLSETPAYIAACAEAPWSCPAYVYDAVTATYLDNSALSAAPLNSAMFDRAAISGASLPMAGDPMPSAAAYQAIALFAVERTGSTIVPLYAGSLTEDVTRVIGYLPDEISGTIALLLDSADAAYWGLWAGGAGAVMFADCTDAAACAVTGGTAFPPTGGENEAGALVTFSLETMPIDAAGALAAITQVYPALRGLAFTAYDDISAGFAFRAITGETGYPESPGVMRMGIIAGVIDVQGRTVVYVVLAGTTIQATMPQSPFT